MAPNARRVPSQRSVSNLSRVTRHIHSGGGGEIS